MNIHHSMHKSKLQSMYLMSVLLYCNLLSKNATILLYGFQQVYCIDKKSSVKQITRNAKFQKGCVKES